jgi:very-short-patch-repair endonuclease
MWRQAASQWSLDDLIIAGDFLVHPRRRLITLDDLHAEVAEAGDVHGLLRAALQEIRAGAESAEESRLRLLLTRAGLPAPVLNMNLFDSGGRFVARLDLAYPEYRVAPEYDGRGHAEAAQFARDADRWDAIRAQDWTHVRILSHHLWPNPQVAVDKVSSALFAAGLRPGRA